jgi:nicotine blue oxidoreductase
VIAAVVLAAGASTRMGDAGPKALLRGPDGRRFVDRVAGVARAGGCGLVVVVCGPPHGEAVRRALPAGCAAAWNPRPERGMLSSVQSGVAALPPAATAALVWPVDVAFVKPETVRAICAAAPGQIVIPQTGQGATLKGGHPVRIPRARFAELSSIDPALGLRALMAIRPEGVHRLSVEDAGVLFDVDTPDDLRRA